MPSAGAHMAQWGPGHPTPRAAWSGNSHFLTAVTSAGSGKSKKTNWTSLYSLGRLKAERSSLLGEQIRICF